MAYLAHSLDFRGAAQRSHRPARSTARRGFWRALADAVTQAHQRQTEREIEAFVARRGRLTDSMEREITERLIGGWGGRR